MNFRRRSSHAPVDYAGSVRVGNSEEMVPRISFTDFESIIRKFSGDETTSIGNWILEFEQYATTFGLNDLQRFIFCKRSLEGAAKLYVDCEAKPLTYLALKTALLKEFLPKVNSAEIHKKLSTRKRKSNESLREYLYKMIDIASQAEVDSLSIINYVISGISDSPVNKSVLYGAQTIEDFKEKLIIYEKIKSDSDRHVSGGSSNSNRSKTVKESDRGKPKVAKYCYNCGSSTHEWRECPEKEKGPRCFKCNNFGHKSSDCPNRNNPSTSTHTATVTSMCLLVKVNGVQLESLVDTGSDICLIKEAYLKIIKPESILKNMSLSVFGLGSTITTKGRCKADLEINGDLYKNMDIHIVENSCMRWPMILGMSVLRHASLKIDEGNVIVMQKKQPSTNEPDKEEEEAACFLAEIEIEPFKSYDINVAPLLSLQYQEEILYLIKSYKPIESPTVPISMKITPTNDKPIYKTPRRFPPQERDIIKKQVTEWLQKGIVKESVSDYCSQVVLVKKKDNSYRLCVDFRDLNRIIHKDRYPLPNMEDQIDKLSGSKYFTTLDLENGFFHVAIEEESRKYTSFVTQDGQYEFQRVPFGLCNSPGVFQKYINYIFRELINEGVVIIYIDDIVIPSSTIEEGIERLKKALLVAERNGLNIKWQKCQFLQKEIDYLGHLISENTIAPSLNKTKAVLNFPVPDTAKKLQSFLGLAGYFRKFISNFALKAKPLTELLKKGAEFKFAERQHEAFQVLKEALAAKPVLRIFRYGARTEVHTDASKFGYGAVLLQQDSEDDELHPVYYMSRTTTEAEKNYCSYELEVLVVIQAVKKFRVYLLGQPFKIVTDCKAFECTIKKKDLTTRVARWALLLEEFNYQVEHRSASRLKHVDALSRNPAVMWISQTEGFLRRLAEAQKKDDRLNAIMKLLEEKPYKDYTMQHGILCKVVDNKVLFVVPEQMVSSIIKDTHEQGHFHRKKMKEIINKEFFITNLDRRIDRHISGCVKCILGERKYGKAESLLHPIPKGERPLDTFHIDHLGPMHNTNKNYKYIFAVMDGFSKYCWLFPTKTLAADEVMQKLEIVADIFGYPNRIIADKGGAFTSSSFQQYCKDHDIKLHLTTAGIPRGNGQIERLHAIVIPGLTKLSLHDPEKWYTFVRSFQRVLNSTYQRAINTTPFQLLTGVKMKTNSEKEIMAVIEEEYLKTFNETRDAQRQKAKLDIQNIQDENRRTFNKKRRAAKKYSVGDLVAIERTQFGVGLKLKAKFLGPYKVVADKGLDRYKVEKIGETEGPRVTESSADKMKPWAEQYEDTDIDEGEEENEEEEYSSGSDE